MPVVCFCLSPFNKLTMHRLIWVRLRIPKLNYKLLSSTVRNMTEKHTCATKKHRRSENSVTTLIHIHAACSGPTGRNHFSKEGGGVVNQPCLWYLFRLVSRPLYSSYVKISIFTICIKTELQRDIYDGSTRKAMTPEVPLQS